MYCHCQEEFKSELLIGLLMVIAHGLIFIGLLTVIVYGPIGLLTVIVYSPVGLLVVIVCGPLKGRDS